jgi:hypothetical protein
LTGAPPEAWQGGDLVSSSILLEKIFFDDVCAVYRGRALIVLIWRAEPTVLGVAPVTRALFAALKDSAASTLMCVLIDTEMPMPDSATREVLQAGLNRIGVLRGAVNVISGSGFRAAALRAMLSGFGMVMRQRYPTSFAATESEAALFLVKHWPERDSPAPSPGELVQALAAAKASCVALKSA